MPKYLMRFFVETPLQADEDLQFRYRDHTLNFLFRSGGDTPRGVEVETICEGDNYREAGRFASEQLIPSVLDGIAFHRKTPLVLGDCTRILKAEPGRERRKMILVKVERYRVTTRLLRGWAEHIQHNILECEAGVPGLPLRWLRTSYRPLSIIDRFIYTWLSLENLAGERDVEQDCPHCRKQLAPYRAANRNKAFEILKSDDPALERKTFNDWWNRLRNSVFHGGKEPDAKFMTDLQEATHRIARAVESWLEGTLKVVDRNPADIPVYWERQQMGWYFLEFDAPNPKDEFPERPPQLSQLVHLMESGRSTEEEMGCRTIGQRHFENW